MKIGELARATDTPVETIRYYEREGLLPAAPRTHGNYRIYGDEQMGRLAFIRNCRSLDMTLDEIRVLLRFKDSPTDDCGEVNQLLEEHMGHVQSRIRELQVLYRQLRELRRQCLEATFTGDCGILNGLARDATEAPAAPSSRLGHVHGTHRARPAGKAGRAGPAGER